jgi:AcrR family transcriptional regulator
MARPANPNLRDALIEAGRSEFAERGIETARIEDITRRAGVSKGAFYLHFEGKEQLFEHIVGEFTARVLAKLRRNEELMCGTSNQAPDPLVVPLAIAADVETLELLWESRATFRLLMEGGTPLHAHLRDSFLDGLYNYFYSTALDGKPGLAMAVDPDAFAIFVTGAFLLTVRQMLRDDHVPDFYRFAWNIHRLVLGGAFRAAESGPYVAALERIRPDSDVTREEIL